MARMSPAEEVEYIHAAIRAWRTHAPGHSFWNMAFPQFKAEMKLSLDADAKVLRLRRELSSAVAQRRVANRRSLKLISRIAQAVKGDPKFGEDCQLLEDLGYTRESVRCSKLRRKRRKRSR